MKKNKHDTKTINKVIEMAGGAPTLARLLGVTYHTVVLWKNGHFAPNPLNCMKIEKALNGKIKRQELLPDYPWDELS